MKMKSPFLVAVTIIVLILAGCGGDNTPAATSTPDLDETVSTNDTPAPAPTEEPTPAEPIYGEANVDSIQVMILESFPVQVNLVARGDFPDGCTSIDAINSERTGNTFQVLITTVRPGDAACSLALVPFEETISLDVLGLAAGQYTVSVNGVNGSFTLDVDNVLPDEGTALPTPEPTATPEAESISPAPATIRGRVWHDLCAVAPGEGEAEAVPSEGCIATADGDAFQANGLLETGEPGIGGVVVSLGEGSCPADEIATAVSDENGDYSFSDLSAGAYCIFVDALAETNRSILTPGAWTYPDANVNQATVELGDGENLTRVNFGWDFQFLPVPEVDAESCTNAIEFLEDVTVPDDTVFAPGETFEKVWRLRNIGTCPWTTEYSLTFANGDGLIGPESVPLTTPVVPGQTVDLSVSLTAPDEFGTYRANWLLSDADGTLFGVDGIADETIWVQIVVAEPQPTPVPHSAVIGGVVWSDRCFLLSDGSPSAGCVETEEGSSVYVADGSLTGNEPRLPDLVVTLSEGACPDEGDIPPGDVINTTTTDASGLYRFSGLDEGTYCVSIDAFSEDNVEILIPGDWTWPARGVGRLTVFLDAGEELLEIDFGWDDGSD